MVEMNKTSNMSNTVTLNVTKDQLDAAPSVDLKGADLRNNPDWDQEISQFWANGGMAITGTQTANNPTPVATHELAPTVAATGTMTAGMPLQGSVLASNLIKYDVKSDQGDEYGNVKDAVINPASAQVQYLLVAPGKGLNLKSDSWLIIPIKAFQWSADGKNLVLPYTADVLNGAPNFTEDSLPNFAKSGWDSQITSYWNSKIK
jgi:sporulation protein YlmC with PRC-barrel domain